MDGSLLSPLPKDVSDEGFFAVACIKVQPQTGLEQICLEIADLDFLSP